MSSPELNRIAGVTRTNQTNFSHLLHGYLTHRAPSVVIRRVMLILLILSIFFLSVLNPNFRQPANLLNIVQQASMVGVVACGMQLMIISGGFDLSVGIIAAAASCLAAYVSIDAGIVPAVLSALCIGLLIGMVNGTLIAKVGMNPFVATFGMQAVVTGILYSLTQARPIAPLPPEWRELGFYNFHGLTFSSIVFIVVVITIYMVLRFTQFGQHVYAVGSNKVATRRAGVKVEQVVIATYAVGGLTAAIAGILLTAIAGVGSPQAGTTWALLSIAAVVIGGTPLTGGVGGIISAVIGVFALTILNNAMTLYSISAFWQPAFMGLGVLLAVGYEARKRRHGA